MFEKASRLKLRFETGKGLLSVEDLWDLPLTVRGDGVSLDNLAKALNKKVKEDAEESFVVKKSEADTISALKFDIVKYIIGVKLSEIEASEKKEIRDDQRKRILEIIADKNDEGLRNKTVEELRDMLKEE
jgi:chemotaxis signal transduction protein